MISLDEQDVEDWLFAKHEAETDVPGGGANEVTTSVALPILRGPRIPETAGHGFKCEYLRGTLTGSECLRRQTHRVKAGVNAIDKSPRIPERLKYCASGTCAQGNEIRAKFPDWKPEERTKLAPSWATYVQPPPEPLPPAIAEDIAEDLARAAQQAERDQAAAAVEEAQPAVAQRAPKARRSWDEFRERKEKLRAATPAEEKREPEPRPLSRRGMLEAKEEEDVEEKHCKEEGCDKTLRSDNESGYCTRHFGKYAERARRAAVSQQRNGAPANDPPRRRARAAQRVQPAQAKVYPGLLQAQPDGLEQLLAERRAHHLAEAERCDRALKALRG